MTRHSAIILVNTWWNGLNGVEILNFCFVLILFLFSLWNIFHLEMETKLRGNLNSCRVIFTDLEYADYNPQQNLELFQQFARKLNTRIFLCGIIMLHQDFIYFYSCWRYYLQQYAETEQSTTITIKFANDHVKKIINHHIIAIMCTYTAHCVLWRWNQVFISLKFLMSQKLTS